jgi:dTDP-glucose pyrophosphorylase
MKALILAAGRGKRLKENTDQQNKCMLVLLGKPVIEYTLDIISTIDDIDEIVIVVGYMAEDIVNRYGTSYKGKKIKYVIQSQQKGLVHAIESAKHTINGDDFMLFLGDEIMLNPRHHLMIDEFKKEKLFSICGVFVEKNKERISKTYAIMQDEQRRIFRMIEKPRKPLNDWMGTGNCIFRNEIFSYIERTPINPSRGEKELPDLIQCAIDEGNIVKSFNICDWYTNINSEEDLGEAENYLAKFSIHYQAQS